ncbi:Glucose-6-phosphate isomerase [hydrothermal vent metagenome]|uniref:Glucose-6-phosphate isomerase n=1 Tax=hydrothermal vent metagenome TaxID=652676 RepID=A0A3B0QM93_9ZZZZ
MTDTGTLILSLGDYRDAYELLLGELKGQRFSERLRAKDALLWSDKPGAIELIPNALGWYDVPSDMTKELEGLASFASEIKDAGFLHVVLCGMGGSSLAPIVLNETFGSAEGLSPASGGFPELIVLDSTDPAAIKRVASSIDPLKTLFIVASKSGNTVEPLSFYEYFYSLVSEVKGADAGRNFISITDPGSFLESLSKEKGFRRVFLNRADIGGRYSVLSYFGLVPAALIGIDLNKLFRSITAMVGASTVDGAEQSNPAVQLGAALAALALKGRDKITFIGSEGLESFGLWIEQLIAESTGKEGKGIVPITGEAVPEPKDAATTPAYGDDRVFVYTYLKSAQSGRFLVDALRDAGEPVIEIELGDKYDLGGEFYRWEIATAVAGAALEINPFDQPNVEEAKLMAKACLEKMGSGNGGGADAEGLPGKGFTLSFGEETRKRLGKTDDISAAIKGFSGLIGSGFYVGVLPYFDPSDKMLEGPLSGIREVVGRRCAVATQFGYGPRYLHSTGQLHKGGGSKAAFIIITHARGSKSDDAVVPGKPYTFWDLEFSQAMGDMAALDANGRAVMHIELASVKAASLKEFCKLLEINL